MHAFLGITKLTRDTCTLHQRKYRSVILITIKVLNIRTDRSDPDQTAPSYEQSDQGLHCFVIPPASVYAFTAIKKRVIYRLQFDSTLTVDCCLNQSVLLISPH